MILSYQKMPNTKSFGATSRRDLQTLLRITTMQLPWLLLLSLASAASSSSVNDTHLWGAYRPNLYFGIRPRIPQSLLTGLMWFGTQDYNSMSRTYMFSISGVAANLNSETRHACTQGELDSYTWTKYDPSEGGIQVIKDSRNNVQITTEFLKVAGGDHGGSWAARIKGEPLDPCTSLSSQYVGYQYLNRTQYKSQERPLYSISVWKVSVGLIWKRMRMKMYLLLFLFFRQ